MYYILQISFVNVASFGITIILHSSAIKEPSSSDGKSAWLDIRRFWVQSLVGLMTLSIFLCFQFSHFCISYCMYKFSIYVPDCIEWQRNSYLIKILSLLHTAETYKLHSTWSIHISNHGISMRTGFPFTFCWHFQ